LISLHANATGQAQNRLRNWVSFMVFAGAIERALLEDGTPAFWFKGGVTMQARFPGPARATRDVDAMFRIGSPAADGNGDANDEPVVGVDHRALWTALDEALSDGYLGFTLEAEEPKQIRDTVFFASRIKLSFAGRSWSSVKLEISPPEGSASEPEKVPALPLDFVGLQGPKSLPCVPVRYQIAQKLHAVTERFSDRENGRERDLIDLILLRKLVDDLGEVRDACVETFATRRQHTWPPELNAELAEIDAAGGN
jgi:hypothetical protein